MRFYEFIVNKSELEQMVSRASHALLVGTALLLGGCSYVSDSLWPSLTGDDPAGESPAAEKVAVAPSKAEQNSAPTLSPAAPAQSAPSLSTPAAPPQLGSTQFVPPGVTSFQNTGTYVGQKIAQMRQELGALQNRISQRNTSLQQIRQMTAQNAQRYHGTIAAVNARLQLGTTPGNPVLVNQWNQAQAELDRLGADIAAMNSLANEVAADSSFAAYLLESARATYGLSGAIDQDHKQLAVLEDETNRTVVLIDRLLNELSEDVSRQTAYVANERSNLTTLSLAIKNGELYGTSLANRAFAAAAAPTSFAPQRTGNFAADTRRPLVVIRFDRADVPYQQALYTAVSRALERRPQASFDLVAVSPSKGSAAQVALAQSKSRKYAEKVMRTLIDMGLPASRITLSATTSPTASTNEVDIYVR